METLGERGEVVGIGTTSEVVDDAAGVIDFLKGAVWMLVVEIGRPVGRLVLGDFARSTLGIEETVIGRVDTKVCEC